MLTFKPGPLAVSTLTPDGRLFGLIREHNSIRGGRNGSKFYSAVVMRFREHTNQTFKTLEDAKNTLNVYFNKFEKVT